MDRAHPRTADTTSDLDQTLSEVILELFAPATVQGTLRRIVDLAVAAVDGCDAAGLFLVEDGQVTTTAASHPLVVELDRLQFEIGEGPCVDSLRLGGTVYALDLADDERWPTFGPRAIERDIRSALAFALAGHDRCALNLYARLPAAFGASDRARAAIFATLAGIALDSAQQRAQHEQSEVNLTRALETREVIGQAQGILMEREHITAEQAFDVLRHASQNLNVKLREVAAALVETGESPTGSE